MTTSGSLSPLWSPDGKQLFYLDPQQRIVAVDVQTQPSFVAGKSTLLPIPPIVNPGPRPYDISPDGKYFVVIYPKLESISDRPAADQINVTVNWFEELRQRVPVD